MHIPYTPTHSKNKGDVSLGKGRGQEKIMKPLTLELVATGLDFLFLQYAKSDLPEYTYNTIDDIDMVNYVCLCGVLERVGLVKQSGNTYSITKSGEQAIERELINHGIY